MSFQKNVLLIAQEINREIKENGLLDKKVASDKGEKHLTYDELITNKSLRRKTRKLFLDGHHARAVEEAYKLLDNLVKKKVGLQDSELTGASLMRHVFSKNHPLLRFNEGKTASEQDEQLGYMEICAGCMTGIRNPRAHESDWEDTEERALQLLVFANHLIERTQMAQVVDKNEE